MAAAYTPSGPNRGSVLPANPGVEPGPCRPAASRPCAHPRRSTVKIMRTTCGLLVALALAGCRPDVDRDPAAGVQARRDERLLRGLPCPPDRERRSRSAPPRTPLVFPDEQTRDHPQPPPWRGNLVPTIEGPGAAFFKVMDAPPSIPGHLGRDAGAALQPGTGGTVSASLQARRRVRRDGVGLRGPDRRGHGSPRPIRRWSPPSSVSARPAPTTQCADGLWPASPTSRAPSTGSRRTCASG